MIRIPAKAGIWPGRVKASAETFLCNRLRSPPSRGRERSEVMGNESHEFLPDDPQPGPSWQRAGWPLVGGAAEDDLTQALDPLAWKSAIKASADKAGAPLDEAAIAVSYTHLTLPTKRIV